MSKTYVDLHFKKIDELLKEIEKIAPATSYPLVKFRADLAGLLVVAMAASYENCVKNTIIDHASKYHTKFGGFAQRQYEKLNSRVRVSDLKKLCELFDPEMCLRFKSDLSKRKKSLLDRSGKNIETSYEQILSWRHDFAHAGLQNTTIEEASATHRAGKRVLYVFHHVFS